MANQITVTALWNGGWDDYLVDLDDVREMTPEEISIITNPKRNDRYFPELRSNGRWLRARFSGKTRHLGETALVAIVKHLGGGD